MCRFAQNAQPWPILDGDKPLIYPSAAQALIAAQGHVIQHINGTMRRDGAVLEARSKADELFNLPRSVKAKGREKRTEVERRRITA